jgi:hypothetical protein
LKKNITENGDIVNSYRGKLRVALMLEVVVERLIKQDLPNFGNYILNLRLITFNLFKNLVAKPMKKSKPFEGCGFNIRFEDIRKDWLATLYSLQTCE